ncbi:MAG TPA: hypothetical protein VFX39_07205, partial [Gemmatimonadaceae bacterium]|nr:hypothetical protein [Gemmatimonadaceae bacterium]
ARVRYVSTAGTVTTVAGSASAGHTPDPGSAIEARFWAPTELALVPGGFLVLGKVETLLGDSRRGFDAVVARERVFRRVGGGRETHMTHMTHMTHTALSPRGDAPARGA